MIKVRIGDFEKELSNLREAWIKLEYTARVTHTKYPNFAEMARYELTKSDLPRPAVKFAAPIQDIIMQA